MVRFATGLFSTAYMDGEHVILKSICRAKECLALFGFGDSNYWPQIEQVERYVYRMPFYQPLKKSSLDVDQWALYQALRAHTQAFNSYVPREPSYDRYDRLYAHWAAYPFIQEALESLTNYGQDIDIEVSPRNVKVQDGKIILLDIFFFRDAVAEVRKTGRKALMSEYFS